ncbi:MAG: DMT family transporter [Chitinophagales bacterium]|nr:DMT family transporter [Chitinophagales bacterium]
MSLKRAYLYLHISILLAGFTGIFGRLIELSAIPLVWYRVMLAAPMIAVFMYIQKQKIIYPLTDIWAIAKSGIVLSIHWIFFYSSIKYSNVSIAVVCFGLIGFFTTILQTLIQKAKFSFVELSLSLIAIAGIVAIFNFETTYKLGITLGIISAFLAALYTVLNKSLVEKYKPTLINLYQLTTCAVVMSFILPFQMHQASDQHLIPDTYDIFYLLLFAFFCTAVLYILFNKSLQNLSPITVTLSYNLEPVYSIILAIFIFNENSELSNQFYLGVTLILLSVFLQSLYSVRAYRKLGRHL